MLLPEADRAAAGLGAGHGFIARLLQQHVRARPGIFLA